MRKRTVPTVRGRSPSGDSLNCPCVFGLNLRFLKIGPILGAQSPTTDILSKPTRVNVELPTQNPNDRE